MIIVGVIPARYQSTRLPGKPLADLGGKPVIQYVYESASKALDLVYVATDDNRIMDAVNAFGGKAVMTDPKHSNGSERVAEVAAGLDADIIVNVQGDEPFIAHEMIRDVVTPMQSDVNIKMATLCRKITSEQDIHNPSIVKVVRDKNDNALYFSRSVIPYPRYEGFLDWYEHIGLYAYRKDFLLEYVQWPNTPLEQTESLEQLRILENGYSIKVVETDLGYGAPCIDTPEDLAKAREYLKKLKVV
jgi:3-deoxy-manno-octulosonate cytidylyltransferase (CMP-KDO synthetase)